MTERNLFSRLGCWCFLRARKFSWIRVPTSKLVLTCRRSSKPVVTPNDCKSRKGHRALIRKTRRNILFRKLSVTYVTTTEAKGILMTKTSSKLLLLARCSLKRKRQFWRSGGLAVAAFTMIWIMATRHPTSWWTTKVSWEWILASKTRRGWTASRNDSTPWRKWSRST